MNDNTAGLEPVAVSNSAPEGGSTLVEKITIPMPYVVFATPSRDHACSLGHRDAMLEIQQTLIGHGVPHKIIGVGGKTPPDLARDTLTTMFLEDFPEATDLFFIDDDVGGPGLGEAVMQFLVRQEPVLVGAVPHKSDKGSFPVRFLGDPDKGTLITNQNGALKADRAPMGFCRIKRAALEHLTSSGTAVRYRDPDGGRQLWHLFSCGVAPDDDGELTYWTEDNVFFKRCIGAGIDIWLEPSITFGHTGRKVYEGNLMRQLFKLGAVQSQGIRPNSEASVEHQDYPKFVHGQIAQDAEDEVRIGNEWAAANPGGPIGGLAVVAVDSGLAPSLVSSSSVPAEDPDAPQAAAAGAGEGEAEEGPQAAEIETGEQAAEKSASPSIVEGVAPAAAAEGAGDPLVPAGEEPAPAEAAAAGEREPGAAAEAAQGAAA